uniref:14-3-3 domain-containing protein n=1 Tax=Lactuca sativa TaxID=4236 RepID=A0A9R1X2M2_LACSA|nr:hypothetical protein LSAT_V11C700374840 [Lactuca sativa]
MKFIESNHAIEEQKEMVDAINKLETLDVELTVEEGNLISVGWGHEGHHGEYCLQLNKMRNQEAIKKGDYYRYLVAFKSNNDKKEVADQFLKAYKLIYIWLPLLQKLIYFILSIFDWVWL